MFCTKCGSQVNDKQKVCPNCGNKIKKHYKPSLTINVLNLNLNLKVLLPFVTVGCVLIFLIVYGLNKVPKNTNETALNMNSTSPGLGASSNDGNYSNENLALGKIPFNTARSQVESILQSEYGIGTASLGIGNIKEYYSVQLNENITASIVSLEYDMQDQLCEIAIDITRDQFQSDRELVDFLSNWYGDPISDFDEIIYWNKEFPTTSGEMRYYWLNNSSRYCARFFDGECIINARNNDTDNTQVESIVSNDDYSYIYIENGITAFGKVPFGITKSQLETIMTNEYGKSSWDMSFTTARDYYGVQLSSTVNSYYVSTMFGEQDELYAFTLDFLDSDYGSQKDLLELFMGWYREPVNTQTEALFWEDCIPSNAGEERYYWTNGEYKYCARFSNGGCTLFGRHESARGSIIVY